MSGLQVRRIMHELSLALEICRLTEERLTAAELPRLVRLGVVVGDQSNVEADNLAFCLEALLWDAILADLREKADILGREINRIEGMSLVPPHGAMYAFVQFELPPEPRVDVGTMTVEERLEYESRRDSEYCMSLLEETGICVVPGSGFGQRPGTFHFRTTFVPPKEDIEGLVGKLKSFHERYVRELDTVHHGKITIDGRQIEVGDKQTIIEAAREVVKFDVQAVLKYAPYEAQISELVGLQKRFRDLVPGRRMRRRRC